MNASNLVGLIFEQTEILITLIWLPFMYYMYIPIYNTEVYK